MDYVNIVTQICEKIILLAMKANVSKINKANQTSIRRCCKNFEMIWCIEKNSTRHIRRELRCYR